MKWLQKMFDNTDKEIDRLRRMVAQANSEAEELLETERNCAAIMRDDALAEMKRHNADWQTTLKSEMASVTSQARKLVGDAETLRAVIEQGEQTSRELSVLLADSKQLASMNAERTQRGPAERRELEEEIELLVAELGEKLAAMMEEKQGMREAILKDVPKASFFPKKPAAEEMLKQVDAVAHFLGREVADYFGRTNETIVSLRRSIGLTTLIELTGGAHSAGRQELDKSTSDLVRALYQNDLIKHLSRQGLRLPTDVKVAAGIEDAQATPQQNNRNKRNNVPINVDTAEKDDLADTLYWEEQATAELVAIAQTVVGDKSDTIADIAEQFASREERLQARSSLFRARILEARTAFWGTTWSKITEVVGQDGIAPFIQRFAELDEEQDALVDAIVAQDEDKCAMVKAKPDQV
ncbi:MAG: hypothetical protein ABIQ44_05665, partial [Chloroflexia bacterium]